MQLHYCLLKQDNFLPWSKTQLQHNSRVSQFDRAVQYHLKLHSIGTQSHPGLLPSDCYNSSLRDLDLIKSNIQPLLINKQLQWSVKHFHRFFKNAVQWIPFCWSYFLIKKKMDVALVPVEMCWKEKHGLMKII